MNFEGILLVVLSSIGYWISWKNFSKKNYGIALLFLIVLGALLRFYTCSDFYLHPWDERYHALVAKNMINDPFKPMLYANPIIPYDTNDWTANHIWLHKQPIPLWTMALSMFLFGVNELALRLPSILLSLLGIYLMYEVGKLLFNRYIGFISAFLFSIHGLIIELVSGRTATDHIDVFFMVFILMAIYFSLRFRDSHKFIYTILVGISIGLAILTKWLPALIVFPLWYLILYHSKVFSTTRIIKNGFLIIITVVSIVLPWQFYIRINFPVEFAIENLSNINHLTQVLDSQGGFFLYHFDKMRIIYGELIYVPLIWLIYLLIRKFGNLRIRVLSIWILVPFLFFSFAKTKMQAYTLFAAPALFLLTAYFWYYLKWNIYRFKNKWVVKILLIGLIVLPIRYSLERLKPFQKSDRNPSWVTEIKSLDVGKNDRSVIFNAKNPIEIMFYKNIVAYKHIPTKEILDSLQGEGYTIYFDNGPDMPTESIDSSKYKFVYLTAP